MDIEIRTIDIKRNIIKNSLYIYKDKNKEIILTFSKFNKEILGSKYKSSGSLINFLCVCLSRVWTISLTYPNLKPKRWGRYTKIFMNEIVEKR